MGKGPGNPYHDPDSGEFTSGPGGSDALTGGKGMSLGSSGYPAGHETHIKSEAARRIAEAKGAASGHNAGSGNRAVAKHIADQMNAAQASGGLTFMGHKVVGTLTKEDVAFGADIMRRMKERGIR